MCGQQNIKASARNNTDKNTYPVPGNGTRAPGWKAGTLPITPLRVNLFATFLNIHTIIN